jgi:hypothetical protein
MDGSIAKRQYLYERLKDCECEVHMQGRWTEAGDFANALGGTQIRREAILDDADTATALQPDGNSAIGSEDEEPGFLDILADGEGAFEEMTGVIAAATEVISATTQLAESSTKEIKRSDASGGGMRARLSVVIRYAEALKPHAVRYEELSEVYSAHWRAVHPALEYLLGRIETERDMLVAVRESGFLTMMENFSQAVLDGSESLRNYASSVELSGVGSKQLRPVVKRLAQAARRWEEPAPIARDWLDRIRALPE